MPKADAGTALQREPRERWPLLPGSLLSIKDLNTARYLHIPARCNCRNITSIFKKELILYSTTMAIVDTNASKSAGPKRGFLCLNLLQTKENTFSNISISFH